MRPIVPLERGTSVAGMEPSERAERIEEVALVARSGDARALEELLALIEPDVMARCRRVLPHQLDAEEAAQDALMTVARRIESFEGRSKFRTWLYMVSSNAAVDTYRRLRRHATDGTPLPEITEASRTSVIAGTRIDLLDALDQVDSKFGEPVVLRDVQGMDYSDIADALDLPVGTVKSRIHEGRQRLQRLLDAT